MAIKRNRVKLELGSYPPILIMGERKIGKSTLMYNLAELEYSLDEMLLISCGKEKGFKALDDIQYEECRVWTKKEDEKTGERGFVQVVDDIVKNNNELGLKMVVIDTLDTLFDIGEEDVLKQHLREKKQICKSLNDAFGGFQRGRDRLLEMIEEEIDKLDRMGIAVFILAHTKNKDKTDPLSGDKYEMLTNNLRADLYTPIADSCQMIVNVAIERQIEEGVQTGEKRMMFFRSNGLIDCGGRFNDLPEKLELSAENFMEAFKQGVKGAMRKKVSDEDLEKLKKEEIKENETVAKTIVEEHIQQQEELQAIEEEEIKAEEQEQEQQNQDEIKRLIIKIKSLNKGDNKEIIKAWIDENGKPKDSTVEKLEELVGKLS